MHKLHNHRGDLQTNAQRPRQASGSIKMGRQISHQPTVGIDCRPGLPLQRVKRRGQVFATPRYPGMNIAPRLSSNSHLGRTPVRSSNHVFNGSRWSISHPTPIATSSANGLSAIDTVSTAVPTTASPPETQSLSLMARASESASSTKRRPVNGFDKSNPTAGPSGAVTTNGLLEPPPHTCENPAGRTLQMDPSSRTKPVQTSRNRRLRVSENARCRPQIVCCVANRLRAGGEGVVLDPRHRVVNAEQQRRTQEAKRSLRQRPLTGLTASIHIVSNRIGTTSGVKPRIGIKNNITHSDTSEGRKWGLPRQTT